MRVTITIPAATDSLRSTLHTEAGLDWFEMNTAFEAGEPLRLDYRLEGDGIELEVPRVRRIIDIMARFEQRPELALTDSSGAVSLVVPAQLLDLLLSVHPPNARPVLVPQPDGLALLRSRVIAEGLSPWTATVLEAVRGTLLFDARSAVSADAELDVGRTKLWGAPDLPRGFEWPRRRDCVTDWLEDDGLDPDELCAFVGQIRMEDISQSTCASDLPTNGLLSIFSCTEEETVGTVSVAVALFPNASDLERVSVPKGVMDRAPVQLELREGLSLPSPESPAFGPLGDAGVPTQLYENLAKHYTHHGFRLLGHSFTSTAGDVTPSAEWVHLAHLETPEGWVFSLHVREQDLRESRFHKAQLTYVHPD